VVLELCAWEEYHILLGGLYVTDIKQIGFREVTGDRETAVAWGLFGISFFPFTRVFVAIHGQTLASNDIVMFHHDVLLSLQLWLPTCAESKVFTDCRDNCLILKSWLLSPCIIETQNCRIVHVGKDL